MVIALHASSYLIFPTSTDYFTDEKSENQRGKEIFPGLSIQKVVLLKNYSSTIYNSQNMEATQVPINRQLA